MYKSVAVVALLLLFAVPAFPQSSNSVSVFVTDLAISNSNIGEAHVDAAYGASFDRMFGERFSAELSVTSQRYRRRMRIFTGSSEPASVLVTDRCGASLRE